MKMSNIKIETRYKKDGNLSWLEFIEKNRTTITDNYYQNKKPRL